KSDQHNYIENGPENHERAATTQTERSIVGDRASQRINNDSDKRSPKDNDGKIDVLVCITQKLRDHAGYDDSEQCLPMEVVGDPENVQVNLIEKRNRTFLSDTRGNSGDPLWLINDLHDVTHLFWKY